MISALRSYWAVLEIDPDPDRPALALRPMIRRIGLFLPALRPRLHVHRGKTRTASRRRRKMEQIGYSHNVSAGIESLFIST